jgi:hypothetical protein
MHDEAMLSLDATPFTTMFRPTTDALLATMREPPADLGWDPILAKLVGIVGPTGSPCSPVTLRPGLRNQE